MQEYLDQLVGLRCERIDNPYGSILTIDLGRLTLPVDAEPVEEPRGFRQLTIYSPWRVENQEAILFDWNVDGGPGGILAEVVQLLLGATVSQVSTSTPAWDLTITWSNGMRLLVFGDCTDKRDSAWFLLGTDGTELAAKPVVRPLAS